MPHPLEPAVASPATTAPARRRRSGIRPGARCLALLLIGAGNVPGQLLLPTPAAQPGAATPTPVVPARLAAGEQLARMVCQTCHLFTEPDNVDKKNWKEQILPRMEAKLGVSPVDFNSHPEGQLIRATGAYPDKPMLSKGDWALIEEYFLALAPAKAIPMEPRPEIRVGLTLFTAEPARFIQPPPQVTLVKISPTAQRIYVGDDGGKTLLTFDAKGELLNSFLVGDTPVALVESPNGIYLTCIGSFMPSEVENGHLFHFEPDTSGWKNRQVILQDLHRPTAAEFADFNGDGKDDFLLCRYGDLIGRISWYENLGKERYQEHVLIPKPGALRAVIHDFNGDGAPDAAVLLAQQSETLYLLLNDGHGHFTTQIVFQKPPVYGHSSFAIADFNGDGRMDFLVTCGDNGEYESPLKRYHGIRIYLNEGDLRFREAFYYPMNGAYGAMAADFDEDGDLDIAAISFFPDYRGLPRESFVYLENQGGLKFETSTFAECISGRWIVMDVGDLDGDGDKDIVLGSQIRGPGLPAAPPDFVRGSWEQRGAHIQILRNNLRRSPAVALP